MQWNTLSEPVRGCLVGIFILLGVASLLVALLRWRKPEDDYQELTQRVNTWWVMAIIFTAAIIFSDTLSLLFFALISYLALKEYLSLIPTRRADRRPLFWTYLAIPLQYVWVHVEWYGMFIIFIPVYCFLFIPVRMLTIGQSEGYLRASGSLHWGLMTTVFSLSHAAYLLMLKGNFGGRAITGAGMVLFLVVLTQMNDVAQYVWGKSLGRRKIVPTISPNKTWAGFLGGVGTTLLLAGALGPYLTPMNPGQSAIAGLIMGLGGFCGDMNLSALKRDLGIKDTGTTLPGHGGILDRVDSLTYTAPLFFHYIYYLFDWHAAAAAAAS